MIRSLLVASSEQSAGESGINPKAGSGGGEEGTVPKTDLAAGGVGDEEQPVEVSRAVCCCLCVCLSACLSVCD